MTTMKFATAKEVATAISTLGYQACRKTLVPSATIDMVVPLARTVPIRFVSAIEAASDPTHSRHDDAKAYLSSVFPPGERPAPAPSPAANLAPEAPPHSTQSEPPQEAEPAANERPTGAPSEVQDGKKHHSCHVYGSGYALCFNAGVWDGKPGVMVDAAVATGAKAYDWKNATHIWLDTNEVGAVLAVFRRWSKAVEFSSHGAQNDKSFSIEFQGQHFFAKVSARKASSHPVRAVKIMPADATAVSILFLTQLAESYPNIPLNELLATVRATHHLSDDAAA